MPERRILILFGTRYGHTGRVAEKLAAGLRTRGYPVDLERVDRLGSDFSLARYGAVLLGGSVYRGRFQRELRRFVASNKDALSRLPSAFFSVGLAVASKLPKDQRAAREDLERFVEETGWRPPSVGFIAGALGYTGYNPLLKLLMRLVTRSLGAKDLGRDYVFTDWTAVGHFADGFADMLEQLPIPPEQPWIPPRVAPPEPPQA